MSPLDMAFMASVVLSVVCIIRFAVVWYAQEDDEE